MSQAQFNKIEALTARELAILQLLAEGMSNRDIAEHLWLSVNTVKWHTQRLFDKLGVKSRTQAIAASRSLALSETEDLRSTKQEVSRLPSQSTTFVGRERELAEVVSLLRRPNVRLATLIGPAGAGKTRLSLQAAVDLMDEYEHGVHFVALYPVRDPDLVIPTIASALKLKERPGPTLEALKGHLRDKSILLVLDNFEQVVSAAPALSELLTAAPRLKLVVTSRERLRLSGEHNYSLPPLSLPQPGSNQSVEALLQYESVALYIHRARAANPEFEITDENAPAVAEICIRLDGLPLAIELAAARSRLLPTEALLERLSSRLKALIGGPRDLPARQQTLRNAIDWSYDLLDEGEKILFARLSIFTSGWTLEAAEAVCMQGLPFEVLDGMDALLDKSLVRPMRTALGEPRYMMLETLCEYAAEKLNVSGEAPAICKRHAEYYLSFSKAARTHDRDSSAPLWTERVRPEIANLRAALDWSIEQGSPEVGLQICKNLWRLWDNLGHWNEVHSWLEQAVAVKDVPPEWRAFGLRAIGSLLNLRGQRAEEIAAYEASLEICRSLDDKLGIAACLSSLANIYQRADDYEKARNLYEQSRAIYRMAGGDERAALVNLGINAVARGEIETARDYARQTHAIVEQRGNPPVEVAWCAWLDFHIAYYEEDYEAAYQITQATLGKFSSHDITYAWVLLEQCYVLLRLLRHSEARPKMEYLLEFFYDINDVRAYEQLLRQMAMLYQLEALPEHAARLFGAAEAIRERIARAIYRHLRNAYERDIAALRSALELAAFEAAWTEGRAMSMAQAIQYALADHKI